MDLFHNKIKICMICWFTVSSLYQHDIIHLFRRLPELSLSTSFSLIIILLCFLDLLPILSVINFTAYFPISSSD
jgi:hypothetical protein